VSAAIVLAGLTRAFDGAAAVSHLHLSVDVGEVVLVEGSNGSGKSTLLKVVATALSPTFGSGSVLGADLVRDRSWIRGRVELLGHEPRAYADLTAVENLRFVCALYGLPGALAEPALERVGLAEVATVRAGSFSRGMRQRLALARAVMRDPDVLLLDEPYSGLDALARLLVEDLVDEARERGHTVLLASHERPRPGLVHRTVRMDAGRLREEART
jgi:ABC-type multidrug transport system ATPase subunit